MRLRHILTGLGLAAVATVTVASPAAAHSGGPPTDEPLICQADTWVQVCFEVNGDDFWVKDQESDGRSAVAVWETDYGRKDRCYNSHGNNTWHECDYDLAEHHWVQWSNWTYDGDTGGWNSRSGPYDVYTSI